ncbi:MAG: type II toxin-antitoxin system PemK/MazF family toxin [Nostoc sp. CreGUA01]|nr:type II toxin-antitoxin system PemK/MazF family toxin [Nostoc sp. CreGUA01]
MVDINRGDVLLCDLNPVVGTEQAGIRPVVVVQIDRANAVVPIQSLHHSPQKLDALF